MACGQGNQDIRIQTFVFCNIGTTGQWEEDYALSRIKLFLKPVSRSDLVERRIPAGDPTRFYFDDVLDYEEGKSLLSYDLVFGETECSRLLQYLESLPRPAALVAYNGQKFQFPILRSAVGHLGRILPNDLLCIDLMQAIYEIENNLGPQQPRDSGRLPWEFQTSQIMRQYRLKYVYERLTGNRYDLNEDVPIRKDDNEPGIPVPHIMYIAQCVIAVLDQFLNWSSRPSNSTIFNEGRLLRHEAHQLERQGLADF